MKTATKVTDNPKLPSLLEAASRLRKFKSSFAKLSASKRRAFVSRAKKSDEVSGEPKLKK